jgi:hypothetical protein
MTICHASPDAGWLELQPFFSNVKKSLTVGMYDFILQAFLSGMRNKDLTMVLDHPSPNKTADQSDDQTRADILGALKNPAPELAWELEGMDKLVLSSSRPGQERFPRNVHDSLIIDILTGARIDGIDLERSHDGCGHF